MAAAQTEPPSFGDWNIRDETTISNRQINIDGSIIINEGGNLTLNKVDLRITSGEEGGESLTVRRNGRLLWQGGSLGSYNNYHFKFIVRDASSVVLENITVTGTWQNRHDLHTDPREPDYASDVLGGMQIFSNNVTVSDCIFSKNDRVAITVVDASPIIRDTLFIKPSYFTYYRGGYLGYREVFLRDAYGIICIKGNPRIERCRFQQIGDYDTAYNDLSAGAPIQYVSLEGHGIYASNGAPEVLDCIFSDIGRMAETKEIQMTNPSDGGITRIHTEVSILRGCIRGYECSGLKVIGCNFTRNYMGFRLLGMPAEDSPYAVVIEGGRAEVRECNGLRNGCGVIFSSAEDLFAVNITAMGFYDHGICLTGGGSQRVHDIVLNGTLDERPMRFDVGVLFYMTTVGCDVQNVNITFVYIGVQAERTSLAVIRDVYLENNIEMVYANQAIIECYNVPAEPSECMLGQAWSEIRFFFKLELFVTWQNGENIQDAIVQVFNGTGVLLHAGRSMSEGLVPPVTLLQTSIAGDWIHNYNISNDPLNISAYANGSMSENRIVPFMNDTSVHIVVWDRTPPQVVVQTPIAGHAQNSTRLEVRGLAYDACSGLLGIEVSTDGRNWHRATGASAWWLTLELDEGIYDLQVKGVDVSGCHAVTVIENVTLDKTPPWLHIVNPSKTLSFTNSTSITISGQTEVDSLVFLNGDPLPLVIGQFYLVFDFTSEGLNTFELMAIDRAGNRNVTFLYIYQDVTDPVLIIECPKENFVTNSRILEVSGLTDPEVTVTVNGFPASVEGGLFTIAMILNEGMNVIQVEAVDPAQNHKTATRRVIYDNKAPILTMTFPSRDTGVRTPNVAVSGSVDDDDATVRVNHVPVTVVHGRFTTDLLLDEGDNIIRIDVVDRAGNAVARLYVVTLDTEAPFLDITNPVDGSYATTRSVVVTGRVEVGAVVTLNGAVVNVTGGYIHVPLTLDETLPGGIPNVITVVAMDAVGNQATATVRVVADTKAPRLVLYDTPPRVSTDFFNLSGTVSDPFDLAELSVNGAPVEPNADGFFEAFVGLSLGNNTLTVRAVDSAGNVAVQSISISRESIKVKDEGIMGLGDWSWLLLLLFLGMVITAGIGIMWMLSQRRVTS